MRDKRLGFDRAELREVLRGNLRNTGTRLTARPRLPPVRGAGTAQEGEHVLPGDAALFAGALTLLRSTPSSRASSPHAGAGMDLAKIGGRRGMRADGCSRRRRRRRRQGRGLRSWRRRSRTRRWRRLLLRKQ